MIKFLDIISNITKFVFYGLLLFFAGILISILLGYFKFVESQVPFYFMIGVSFVSLISHLSSDLSNMLKKKAKVITMIPEAYVENSEEVKNVDEIHAEIGEDKPNDPIK